MLDKIKNIIDKNKKDKDVFVKVKKQMNYLKIMMNLKN